MKNRQLINEAVHSKLCEVLHSIGGDDLLNRAFYVGGMVRDHFQNRTSHDVDIVIERVTSENVKSFHENFNYVGKDFPVFKFTIEVLGEVHDIDLAVARIERSTNNTHTGFQVEFGVQVSLHDDLARRDITMNAMAVPLTDLNKLIDPFGGLNDLSVGIIRHTTGAFAEDPLRVFRVARFAARFNFVVHGETIKLMKTIESSTLTLPEDRIFQELVKLFSSAKRPSIFFRVLRQAGNLKKWFPVIHHMIGLDHLVEGNDVFNHTMEVIDVLSDFGGDVNSLIGALYHDVGKILTDDSLVPRHYGHDKLGTELVEGIATRLRLPNDVKRCVNDCIEFHLTIAKFPEMKISKVLKIVDRLLKNGTLDSVVAVVNADRHSKGLSRLDHSVFETINLARVALKTKVPPVMVESFKGKSGQTISKIVECFRIDTFKQLAA